MTKTTESKRRALIDAQANSGLTVRNLAELRDISATTLYWWRSKVRRESTPLVAVEVVDHDIAGPPRDWEPRGFQLQIDGSVTLRMPTGFDETELRRLIRAIRCDEIGRILWSSWSRSGTCCPSRSCPRR